MIDVTPVLIKFVLVAAEKSAHSWNRSTNQSTNEPTNGPTNDRNNVKSDRERKKQFYESRVRCVVFNQ